MRRFEIYCYIILMNLFSMILLIYTPIYWIIIYFLLMISTNFLFVYKFNIKGKYLSKNIKHNHYCIYYKYKNGDFLLRPPSEERFEYLRTDLIRDKNAVAKLNKDEKELLKKYVNSLHGIVFSFVLIFINLIISSMYLI